MQTGIIKLHITAYWYMRRDRGGREGGGGPLKVVYTSQFLKMIDGCCSVSANLRKKHILTIVVIPTVPAKKERT